MHTSRQGFVKNGLTKHQNLNPNVKFNNYNQLK
jgi:hypothetical protein